MPEVIHIAHDVRGQQMAARALLEQAFQRSCIDTALRLADKETRQDMLDECEDLSLSPGYYTRAGYLFDLRAAIRCGAQYTARDLTRDDVVGLQALERAEAEFNRDHPTCSACGARQDSQFAPACRGCGVEFRRRG